MNAYTVRNVDAILVVLAIIFVISTLGIFLDPENWYLPVYLQCFLLFGELLYFTTYAIIQPWKKLKLDSFQVAYEKFHIWSMATVIVLTLGGIWLSSEMSKLAIILYWTGLLPIIIVSFIKEKNTFIYETFFPLFLDFK